MKSKQDKEAVYRVLKIQFAQGVEMDFPALLMLINCDKRRK
jgi:hypothetical protein